MRVPIVYHPAYVAPMPEGHRFPMGKFGALKRYLENQDLLRPANLFEPQPASPDYLVGAHDPAYVAAVLSGQLPPEQVRRLGLPVTPEVARRSLAANGGTLMAAKLALEHGLACNLAGGSHHAFRAFGSGFCVFNDVAAAASHLLAKQRINQALVLDLDVHQGDGTASILADQPRVTTVSLHCRTNFPARKQTSDLDVPLEPDLADGDYLETLERTLDELLASADHPPPDLVFYNAGVDPHRDDRLGRLALSDAGLMARERLVLQRVTARGIPLVCVVGGGYDHDIDRLAARHAFLHHAIAELPGSP
ncbi:MAG: histone deacetylase [Pseudomonadota bacterium]